MLVGAVLLGCTGTGQEVETPPSPTGTSSETPEPEPIAEPSPAPTRPLEMETFDEDGAKAAATYFLQLFPYVMNTHDLTEWNALSDEVCEYCALVADMVAEDGASGVRLRGGAVSVSGRSATNLESEPPAYVVDYVMTQTAAIVVDDEGAVVDRVPATRPSAGEMVLKYVEGSGWLVSYVGERTE